MLMPMSTMIVRVFVMGMRTFAVVVFLIRCLMRMLILFVAVIVLMGMGRVFVHTALLHDKIIHA